MANMVNLIRDVASSREDAWIETQRATQPFTGFSSRPPARTRGLKQIQKLYERDARVASSREDAWIETIFSTTARKTTIVASSREDAWIETSIRPVSCCYKGSRPPARTRGLKPFEPGLIGYTLVASSREDAWIETGNLNSIIQKPIRSRPPARTRGLKHFRDECFTIDEVASSREDAWIETVLSRTPQLQVCGRVLPRGRVD